MSAYGTQAAQSPTAPDNRDVDKLPPGSALKKRGCQFQQRPSQGFAAVGPLSVPLMPELRNSEALQTLRSVPTTVNSIPFEFLLTA